MFSNVFQLRKTYLLLPLSTSLGFCLLLSSSLARKTKSSGEAYVSSLWYISAYMLKVSLSHAQMVRAAPQFPCRNLTTADFFLATHEVFCGFTLFCVSSFQLQHLQQCKGFLPELNHWDLTLFTFKFDYHFCTMTLL